MGNITLSKFSCKDIEKVNTEVVERKGLGHPDYIADSIAESFSINLSKYYIDKFGRILHHNVDKLELIGGSAKPAFGGGSVLKQPTILFSGRATSNFNGELIPVREIAENSAKHWIKDNIRFLEGDKMRYLFETSQGSGDLTSGFYNDGKRNSNDTSFAVGYYPLSSLEELVLKTEQYLNSQEIKKAFPFSGEDVKVMGLRTGNTINLTIAMAFVDRFVSSESDYFKKKREILTETEKHTKELIESINKSKNLSRKVRIRINGMDRKGEGANGCYLTVTGLSAENGDDGAVGRGNRVNGLITPSRPMTLEAAAGKNPVTHIGKIYSLVSFDLSKKIYDKFGLKNQLTMLGRIGDDIRDPLSLSVLTDRRVDGNEKTALIAFISDNLASLPEITDRILKGELSVC
jgi:S-adenosylmethionine synthetase